MFQGIQKWVICVLLALTWNEVLGQIDTLVPPNKSDELNIDIGITRNRNKYIWPLIYREKTETSYDLQLMFTLYRDHQYFDVPYSHHHLLPLYWYTKSGGVTSLKLATTYYPSLINFEKDSAAGITRFKLGSLIPNIELLNVSRSKNGLFVENNFFFFIFSKNDSLARKSHLVVFPLYWHYEKNTSINDRFTENIRTTSVFPIFSFKSDIIFNPRDNYVGATTIQRNWVFYPMLTKVTKYVNFGGLRSGDSFETIQNKFSSLFLIYHSHYLNKIKNSGSTEFHIDFKSQQWVLFPVLFYKKRFNSKQYLNFRMTVFPLVFYKNVVDGNHSTGFYSEKNLVVFPVYWNYQDNFGRTLAILPFRYHEENKLDTLDYYFPNVWVSKSSKVKVFQVYPLYYSLKSKMHNYNVLFPFYYSSQRKGLEENTKITSIAFWYWHTQIEYANHSQTNSYSLLPFYYRETFLNGSKKNSTTMITPICWKVQNDAGWSSQLLLPIYWRSVTYTDTTLLLLPFYYSQKSISENVKVYFPFVWSYRLNQSKKLFLFPFIYRLNSPEKQSLALFPLFFKYHDLVKKDKIYSMLFWFWSRERESQIISKANGMKEFVPGLRRHSLIPFYYYDALQNGDTTTMVTPIFWSVKNQFYKSKYLFPLYSSYSDKNINKKSLFPIIWYERNPMDTTLAIIPLYYSERSKFGLTKWVTPLYFSEKTNVDTTLVLFPIYWKFKSTPNYFKMVFPFYVRHESFQYSLKMVTPFYLQIDKHKEQLKLWAYLFYQKQVPDDYGVYKTTGMPLVFSYQKFYLDSSYNNKRRQYTKYKINLTPLIQLKSEREELDFYVHHDFSLKHENFFENYKVTRFRIAPFVYYSKKETRMFKLDTIKNSVYYNLSEYDKQMYAKRNGFPQDKIEIKPILGAFTDQKFTIFPVYFSRKTIPRNHLDNLENRKVIFPIYWSYQKVLYSRSNLKERSIFVKKKNYLFPFYGKYSELYAREYYKSIDSNWSKQLQYVFDTISQTFVPEVPVKLVNRLTSEKKVLAITPLYWQIHRSNGSHHLLFPFYSYKQTNKNIVKTLDGNDLYQRHTYSTADSLEVNAHILYFLYRYHYADSGVSHQLLYPLVSYENQRQTTKFRIAPIFWYKKAPSQSYQYLIPLYGYRQKDSLKVFQLLLNTYRYTSIEGHLSSHKFLYGIIQTDKYQNGDFENRVCYKLYVNLKIDSSTEKTLFPFYGKVFNKNGNYRKNYLLGLYNKSKTRIPGSNESYVEEKLFWFFRYRSNMGYLKTKGITTEQVNRLTRFR